MASYDGMIFMSTGPSASQFHSMLNYKLNSKYINNVTFEARSILWISTQIIVLLKPTIDNITNHV